jgi:GT2 family glycosyltransferase
MQPEVNPRTDPPSAAELALRLHHAERELQKAVVGIERLQRSWTWRAGRIVVGPLAWLLRRAGLVAAEVPPAPAPPAAVPPVAPAPEITPAAPPPPAAPAEDAGRRAIERLFRSELAAFLSGGAALRLATSPAPRVSVLLVLFNRAELTYRCLRSLAETAAAVPLEVIAVDNASGDDTPRLAARTAGVRWIRNDENRHFLRGCNQAAAAATGEHLLLLNNDTLVTPGAVEAALRTLESSPDVGAVGGRLILFDGTLQEAGSIVWSDGSCAGYGRGGDPEAPEHMFVRDVDYCSAAFLLTPRRLFAEAGGFDTRYEPAYYEETDYCLRLRRRGMRTVYEPAAAIHHLEFGSSPGRAAAIALQERNRSRFAEAHPELAGRWPHYPANLHVAREAGPRRLRVLVIDDRIPHDRKGAGLPRARAILAALDALGARVTFHPAIRESEDWPTVYADNPRTIEFIRDGDAESLTGFLERRRGFFDALFVSRPHNMRRVAEIREVRPDLFAGVRIVYDAEAVFALREAARRRLVGSPMSPQEEAAAVADETRLAAGATAVTVVSPAEAEVFRAAGHGEVHVLNVVPQVATTSRPHAERSGLLFVGPLYAPDTPNSDGLRWFVGEVLPRVQSRLGASIGLTVVGEVSPQADPPRSPHVDYRGPADNLAPMFEAARVLVAPMRFAAGTPIKVLTSAAYGVPVVATTLAAGQLGLTDGIELLAADDPDGFAERVARVYEDSGLWLRMREAAAGRLQAAYSPERFRSVLRTVLRLAE